MHFAGRRSLIHTGICASSRAWTLRWPSTSTTMRCWTSWITSSSPCLTVSTRTTVRLLASLCTSRSVLISRKGMGSPCKVALQTPTIKTACLLDYLLVAICQGTQIESCVRHAAQQLATIAEQFPVEPLQYLPKTLRLSFEEGMKMLQEAGFEVGVAYHMLGLLNGDMSLMRVGKGCQKARRLPYYIYCQMFC